MTWRKGWPRIEHTARRKWQSLPQCGYRGRDPRRWGTHTRTVGARFRWSAKWRRSGSCNSAQVGYSARSYFGSGDRSCALSLAWHTRLWYVNFILYPPCCCCCFFFNQIPLSFSLPHLSFIRKIKCEIRMEPGMLLRPSKRTTNIVIRITTIKDSSFLVESALLSHQTARLNGATALTVFLRFTALRRQNSCLLLCNYCFYMSSRFIIIITPVLWNRIHFRLQSLTIFCWASQWLHKDLYPSLSFFYLVAFALCTLFQGSRDFI